MDFLNRNDSALALTGDPEGKLAFAYQSKRHAILFGAFTLAFGVLIGVRGDQLKEIHFAIFGFACFLSGALGIGAIVAMSTRCDLVVDGAQESVSYRLSNLFGTRKWNKVFSEFKEIRIYRPTAGSGGAGHSVFRKVLLISGEGDEIPLGSGMLGSAGEQRARGLAETLSKVMSLELIGEESQG